MDAYLKFKKMTIPINNLYFNRQFKMGFLTR